MLFTPAGDAKVTLIDPRDVAAVAAVVLTQDGHEGRTYPLTGPAPMTDVVCRGWGGGGGAPPPPPPPPHVSGHGLWMCSVR